MTPTTGHVYKHNPSGTTVVVNEVLKSNELPEYIRITVLGEDLSSFIPWAAFRGEYQPVESPKSEPSTRESLIAGELKANLLELEDLRQRVRHLPEVDQQRLEFGFFQAEQGLMMMTKAVLGGKRR